MGKSNIIELNGKRYDALTGSLLGESSLPAVQHTAHEPVGHRGRFIDGFVKTPKRVSTNATQLHATKPAPFIPVKPMPTPKSAPAKATRSTVKHLSAHHPEHAKTLMRSAVAKPAFSKKPLIKTQAPAEVMAKPAGALVPKLSAAQVDPARLERAHDVQKSETIKKFTPAAARPQGAPRAVIAPLRTRSGSGSTQRQTVAQGAQNSSRQQLQAAHHVAAAKQPAVSKPKEDIFEAALARATSHEQPRPSQHKSKKQRAHRRWVNVLAGAAAALVIVGFVGYLNASSIELHVASIQAGFHATMPGYQPVGYAMSRSVSAHNNQVTISFHSDNGTGFKITQQPSNWDSSTLYDNLIASASAAHQTIETNGRTVYLFNNTSAAWVNGGVLYQISGNAELSNDQVGQIAASM